MNNNCRIFVVGLVLFFGVGCESFFKTGEPLKDENVQEGLTRNMKNLEPTKLGTSVGGKILSPLINASDAMLPSAMKPTRSHENEIRGHIRNLGNDRYDSRYRARQELVKYGAESVPYLVEALRGERDYTVRTEAGLALSAIGNAAVPPLIKLLEDKNWSVRYVAIEAISDIGPPASAAGPRLTELTKDDNKNVRRAAYKALGDVKAKNPEALAVLKKGLSHPDTQAQINSVESMIRIEGVSSSTAQILADIFQKNQNPQVRTRIIQGIDNMNLASHPQINPILRQGVQDSDQEVREYASQALENAQVTAKKTR